VSAKELRDYLAKIGAVGGRKSRRTLTPSQARGMVAVRLARQAFKTFRTQCFWSYKDISISSENLQWVVDQLRRNGNRAAWGKAAKIQSLLCR
jgi:hypothetical protein